MLIVKEGTNGWDGTDEATKKMAIEGLEKEGVTVRTAEQDKSYLTANSKKVIDEAFRERNQQLEDTVKKLTGIDKAHAGEKYYEYFERAITLKNTELTALQDKLVKFEADGNSAMVDDYKKQVEALQKQITTSKTEFDKKLAEKDGAVFQARFQAGLDKAVGDIKKNFRGDLAEDVIPDIIKARTMEFQSKYKPKEVDGITILYDEKGEPAMNTKDGKPYSIEDKLTEIFAPYIDTKKVQSGAGSGKPGTGAKPGAAAETPAWKEQKLPDTVKSKTELTKWLQSDMKLKTGTPDWDSAYTHFSKGADGKELPIKAAVA